MTLSALALAAQAWLSPCTIDQIGPARCGTYEVWENREAKSGRRIPLNVIVLPAASQPARPDPLVFLQGGPGDAPSFNARFYNGVFASVRTTRDLVLIDLRGTGQSAALTCPEFGQRDSAGAFDDQLLNPRRRSRVSNTPRTACRSSSVHHGDRSSTTSTRSSALFGYTQVNLLRHFVRDSGRAILHGAPSLRV